MKIVIKKRYLGITASALSVFLAYWFANEVFIKLSQEGFTFLILPSIFLISTVYAFNYWSDLKSKEDVIDEASDEVSHGDPVIAQKVKEHLWNKYHDEAYTINILKGGEK